MAADADSLSEITSLLEKYGQSHLLKYKDTLSKDELNDLIEQIKSIDFALMSRLFAQTQSSKNDNSNTEEKQSKDKIDPFPLDSQFNIYKNEEKEQNTIKSELNDIGFENIFNGKCGIIILAGGAGTRLGSKDPKGLYNIGLPSNKPIFQLHIEKAVKVKQLAFQYISNKNKNNNNDSNIKDASSIYMPLFIMTSVNTHTKTLEFLEKNKYFGYDSNQVRIFTQEVYPCLEQNSGKIIMSKPNKIEVSPNGNGGIYTTLEKTGILAEMVKNGLVYIQVFGIDNVLAKIGDPLWFGHCFKEKVDCSNKTCQKTEPTEKIGVMCLRNGKPSVIEYSEITEEMANMRIDSNDPKSDLSYCCGNLATHTFSVEFLQKVVDSKNGFISDLPIHVAIKKIPFWDENKKETIKPDTPNGCKLEYFIFDTFMFASKITTFNILRELEFSPVKNAKGSSSPETARNDISRYWKNIVLKVTNNDVKFENNDNLFEVSNLVSYDGEGNELVSQTKGKTFKLPFTLNYF